MSSGYDQQRLGATMLEILAQLIKGDAELRRVVREMVADAEPKPKFSIVADIETQK